MNKIVSVLSIGAVAVAFAACHNSEQSFPDFDGGTTAYFAYQYPIRTLILGNVETYDNNSDNDGRFTIYSTFGGSYNGINAKINVSVDESLTEGLYFEDGTKVTPLPKDYYNYDEVNGSVLDYAGGFRGGVEVKLNKEKFFNDPLSVKKTYVIPVVMGDFSGVDQINRGTPMLEGSSPLRQDETKWDKLPKDYTMFCVNFINEYTATYLRRGVDNFDKLKYKDVTETVTGDDMCIVVHAEAKKEQVWDNQFWIDAVDPFEEKQTISITMDVKATKAAKATTQVHEAPGSYKGGGFGDVNFTTEWTTVTLKGTIASGQAGGHSIALNLSEFADANDYYFDNISVKVNDIEKIANIRCDDVPNANFYSKTYTAGAPGANTYESTGKTQTITTTYQVPDGYGKVTENRHCGDFVENGEVVYTTSQSRKQVVLPIATTEVGGVPTSCELLLTFDGDNCTVVSNNETICKASGTGKYVKNGAPLAWGNKDRDVLYLDYTIDFNQDDVHYATKDTLVWRDRGSAASIQTYKPVYKED